MRVASKRAVMTTSEIHENNKVGSLITHEIVGDNTPLLESESLAIFMLETWDGLEFEYDAIILLLQDIVVVQVK